MSSFHLPIRLAAAGSPLPREETTATPETPSPSGFGLGLGPGPSGAPPPAHISGPLISPSPLIAEYGDSVKNGQNGDLITFKASDEIRKEAAAGSSNHQFWLKDAKIAEDLFTVGSFLTAMTPPPPPSRDDGADVIKYRPLLVLTIIQIHRSARHLLEFVST